MQITKSPVRDVFNLAYPAILESFFVSLAGLIDAVMVGALGPDAVAAVGLTTQPKFIVVSFFICINIPMSAMVARRFGEDNRHLANKTFITAAATISILAIVLGTLSVIFSDTIMRIAGTDATTHQMAVEYHKILLAGVIFHGLQMDLNFGQRSVGNTKITMRTNLISSAINVVFNYLLIEGHFGFPAWGIKGAAFATVFGSFCATVLAVFSMLNKERYINFFYIIKERITPSIRILKEIFSLGYSVLFEQLLMRTGFIVTIRMAASLGSDIMAIHNIGTNILTLSFAFGDGFNAAATTLTGYFLGRKDKPNAKLYVGKCFKLGVITAMGLSVIFILSSNWLYGFLFDDIEMIKLGFVIMVLIDIIIFFQISQIIVAGCLRSAGDTRYVAKIAIISSTLIRLSFCYFFYKTLELGLPGIWIGMIVDEMFKFIFFGLRYLKGRWIDIEI